MKAALLAAAALLMMTAPTAAQEPPSLSPSPLAAPATGNLSVTAEKVAAARAMMEAQGYLEQMRETAVRMGMAFFDAEIAAHNGGTLSGVPADLLADLQGVMMEEMYRIAAEVGPGLLDDAAETYARYFSLAELERLTVLQRDPVLKKLTSVSPRLTAELGQSGMQAFQPYRQQVGAAAARAAKEWEARQEQGQGT